jgi:hypothetical protein
VTVTQLHRILGKLIANKQGRLPVTIHADTFSDGNSCWTHLKVHGVRVTRINVADDDGGCMENKDGSERTCLNCVLVGDAYEPSKDV